MLGPAQQCADLPRWRTAGFQRTGNTQGSRTGSATQSHLRWGMSLLSLRERCHNFPGSMGSFETLLLPATARLLHKTTWIPGCASADRRRQSSTWRALGGTSRFLRQVRSFTLSSRLWRSVQTASGSTEPFAHAHQLKRRQFLQRVNKLPVRRLCHAQVAKTGYHLQDLIAVTLRSLKSVSTGPTGSTGLGAALSPSPFQSALVRKGKALLTGTLVTCCCRRR